MAMKKRLLRIELDISSITGESQEASILKYDESLYLNVIIRKGAFNPRTSASFDIGGLSQLSRQALLSSCNKYIKTNRDQARSGDPANFVGVKILAGYKDGTIENLTPIFNGQVNMVELISGPPNIITRLSAETNYIDKSTYLRDTPPDRCTIRMFCEWAAKQMQLQLAINTEMADVQVDNMGRTIYAVSDILGVLQRDLPSTVYSFIDGDELIVIDRNKFRENTDVLLIDQFVGSPQWTEYGCSFTTMFNPNLKILSPVNLKSLLNPDLNSPTWIINSLDYSLSSRNNNYTISATAIPSAGDPIPTIVTTRGA
ncbi:hypothetical protein GQ229_004869 [Salmonella enterica]|nr:hypothetical protein [Salmonella enterica]MLG27064.1 hypothetical protein [Salmonella enterica]